MLSAIAIFFFNFITFSTAIPLAEVLIIFGDKNCIAGSLLTLDKFNADVPQTFEESDIIDLTAKLGPANNDKSAMSYINELAQYNDISYSYELIKEEGPPHSKTFTITLYLGDEQYTSKLNSIKAAQQDAAGQALKGTNYEHPPVKLKENEKPPTPTVLLNNLAAKLGLAVTYTLVTDDLLQELNKQGDNKINTLTKKSYLQKLNETIHSNDTIHVRKDEGDLKGPFVVRVDINGFQFFGEAHTVKNAKHEAALKALKMLKEDKSAFVCLNEDNNCKTNKQSIKSPISYVYEAAQKRNLPVKFEVVDSIGPAHKKLFTTKCVVGSLEAFGEGTSKKASKSAAAENILPQLMDIAEVAEHQRQDVPTNKKSKKKKKDKVIKTTFDKIDKMFDNVVNFGKGLVDSIRGKDVSDDNNSKPNRKQIKRSPEVELLKLGQILDLHIQYSDFDDKFKTYSVVDLGIKPSVICLGEGVNQKQARDLASKFGIDTLYKLGFLDNLLDKSMKVSNVLDKEEDFQKFHLEVVENSKDEL